MSRSGLRIGRLFGIDIRVDWSWLLIFLLVTWNLGSVFGQAHPDWGATLQWGLAIVASLLFFISVIAHELAHSLIARARGVPIRNITLFLFGGVSNIQREPDSPQAEFLMAILGPLTSLVIGGVLLLIGGLSLGSLDLSQGNVNELIGQLGPVTTLLLWLGSINVTLGLFNLIPGFPLDGGRVLRSIFWGITDDLRRATRWASWVGQGIAWAMIVAGTAMIFGVRIPFFGTGFTNGLWLIFIGWFLNNASSQSYQRVVVHDVLEGVPVSRMMRTDPPTATADRTVNALVHDHIMQSDDHAFPVLDAGSLVGMVTLDDVRALSQDQWEGRFVRDIMTPIDEVVVTSPDENAGDALTRLASRDVRQLPVTRDGELVGLLRRRDIVRWLQLHAEELS
jgi:Zn-dependent protease/CBS domain-containing protein